MAEKAFVCSNHFLLEVSLNAMSLSHSEPRQVTNEAEELREMTLNDILTLSLRSLSGLKKKKRKMEHCRWLHQIKPDRKCGGNS